jgi:hypothetical protein
MDRALDELGGSPLHEHYDALLLGNLREDVYKFPFVTRFMLGKGLTHYYKPGSRWGLWPLVPSAPTRTGWLVERGVQLWRDGHPRDGAFCLGRAVHLISEMAVPVHAQVVLHWRGDPFELYIERHHRELRRLPLPAIPEGHTTPDDLVHRLAVVCQDYPCDRTNHLPGLIAKLLGLRRPTSADEVVRQVHALVPIGAAYTLALYEMFLARCGELAPSRVHERARG